MTRPPIFPLLLLLLICFLTEVACQSVNPPGKITCYDFDGTAFNNNTQCDGSDVCCGEASQCQANRFCLKPDGQLLRPTCAFFPWSNCSPLCQFEEGTGFLPRVNTCSDGSFCCDNNPNCCADHEGVVLNGSGEVVSTDSLSISATSTTSTSATSSPTSTTSNTPTTSSNSKATPSPTKSASTSQNAISTPTIDADSKLPAPTTQVSHTSANALSTAAAAGIGVGAGLAVILLASAIVYFLLHRRRIQRLETELAARDRAAETAEITVANPKSFAQVYQPYQPYRPSPAIGSAASELPALGPQDRAFELPALDREPRRTSYKIPLRSPLHRF